MSSRSSSRWPRLSVVIPALDEEREIGECLASLARQTFPDFEVIVVDNGSRDATPAIAARYGARVIREPRRGIPYAREAGFRAARGEIIASTDADTVVPVDWLERIHRAFEEDPGVVAVFGPFRHKPGSAPRTPVRPLIPLYEGGLILGQRVVWRLLGLPHFSGANFAVRKEAFSRAGGFRSPDGRFYSDWEDIQLGFKLRKLGKVQYLPDLVVLTSARKLRPASARNMIVGNAKRMVRVHILGRPL